jgi:N-acetylglucosaminyl-diphospho-decaprenol L-rhamnosyltransferase
VNSNFSFCIVLYKSADVLGPMLQTLASSIQDGDEVLLYDNCPESDDIKIVEQMKEELGLNLRYIPSDKNIGFGSACNLMAMESTTPRLVFLNPDTQTFLFDRTIHNPELIVGPYVFYPNGKRQSSSGSSRSVGREFKMKWLRIFEYNQSGDELDYVSGVALSIDRDKYLDLGGFDESFFMYYEDVDLCLRAHDVGIESEIVESWQIDHVGGSSADKIKPDTVLRNFNSGLYFHRKHGHCWLLFVVLSVLDAIVRIPIYLLKLDLVSAKSFFQLLFHIVGRVSQRKKNLGKSLSH